MQLEVVGKTVNKYLGAGVCQGQKGLMDLKKIYILHYIDTIIDSMLRIKWRFQRSSKRLYKNWEMGKSIGK